MRAELCLVIAAYRSRGDHLRAAIGSALAQSQVEVAVTVSDDSPDDRLGALVTGFGDRRVRYRHNRPALGVSRNHWQCLREADSPFVAILNHDDTLAADFAGTLVGSLRQQPDAVLAFCDHWVIDAAGQRLPAMTERTSAAWGRTTLAPGLHRPFNALVLAQTLPIAMGTVFRRAALPADLPDDAGPAYDLWLAYLLSRAGQGAWYVPERLSAWRTHADNLTSAGGLDWLAGSAACWQAMTADPLYAAQRSLVRRKAALSWASCARLAWRQGRRVDCARYAARSLQCGVSMRGLAAAGLPLWPRRPSDVRRPSGGLP